LALARELATVLILTIFAAAPVWAADNPEGYYIKNEQKLEQDVEGEGYVMAYQKVNTKTLQLLNYMHGSGTMDTATLISSNQSTSSYCAQDKDTWVYLGSSKTAYHSNISFLEQNEMVYSPVAMAFGTGWYEKNPVVFNSKLKEKTVGKSYQEGVSMHHQIEYASAFKKDLGVDLQCKEPVPGKGYYSSDPTDGYGLARMRIEEDVTEGTIHVGQLLTDPDSDHGWKSPLIEIDENYAGSFTLTKNMEVCVKKSASKVRPDWLSCCIGGYGSMEDYDRLWGEEEIFDCTCRDVAWGKSWEDKNKEQPL